MKKKKLEANHTKAGDWKCVSNCGACCNLNPEDRPDLDQYLPADELQLYLSMVGQDGWCINYDHGNRTCQIYDERPRFCRVQPSNFASMFGVELAEFNEFAIACCQQQIIGVYGEDSSELNFYNQEVFDQAKKDDDI